MYQQQNKIIVRLKGGIGNQLFSYAASRRLAIKNNSTLILDDISGFLRDYKYRRTYQLNHFQIPCRKAQTSERLHPFPRPKRYLFRLWNKILPFEQRRYIQSEGIDFDSRLLAMTTRGTVFIDGYWQSEQYFKDIETVIRSDLEIRPPTDKTNQALAARILDCQSIAVHVRFFDTPDSQVTNNIPKVYYAHAVKKICKLVGNYAHYFIFSDQPSAARKLIPISNDRITLINHNNTEESAIYDLWLMGLCDHFIIANSTFSWWGAWLANNPDKMVIAPSLRINQGVSSWGFDGLLPDEWIKC
jgi:hypothetical protein